MRTLIELTPEQITEFYEQGFTIVPDVFGTSEITEMRSAFDRMHVIAQQLGTAQMYNGSFFDIQTVKEGVYAGQVNIRKIAWCGAAEPVLEKFGRDERLLQMAAQLLESDSFNQLINQAHYKLPGQEVKFDWHQDSQHRGIEDGQWRDVNGKGSYVQALTAVDDCTPENGPVLFVPGSSKLGHVKSELLNKNAEPQVFDPETAIPALMRAGSVALFGPYTIHGSLPNRSEQSRRVFINGFAVPGASTKEYKGAGAGRLLSLSGTKSDVQF
jgi:ectoine hydroxylase-related dioxygenase (phytanoyl-CoA dioxygenase family)